MTAGCMFIVPWWKMLSYEIKKQNFSSPRWHQKCIIGVPNPSMSVVKGILKRVNYILTSSFSINKPYTVSTKHLVNGL